MSAIPGARVPAAVRPDAAAARQDLLHRVVLALFIGIPLAALAAALPVAWGWGLSWADAFFWASGESWHNTHHADPTCARHGAMRGQVDSSARVIWALEKSSAGRGMCAGRRLHG